MAFILDSGIRSTHDEFGGRVTCGYNFIAQSATNCDDDRGHGTHVAGTVGGATYGVAKGVQLVAVKVLDASGRGSLSNMVGAVDFVAEQKSKNPKQPMVVNMSISGTGQSNTLDDAINRASLKGVIVVVAAGNSNEDACGISPAMAVGAIAVGATTDTDKRSGFSNFGSCIDIFAPGSSIISAGIDSDSSSVERSGTSMACPHVVGAVALYLQDNPTWTMAEVVAALQADATQFTITDPGTFSPNLLLNVGINGSSIAVQTSTTSTPSRGGCSVWFKPCTTRADCCPASRCSLFGNFCFMV
jgi:aqualysin 1